MDADATGQRGSLRSRPLRTILAVAAVFVLMGATTATAAKLITGSDVKNGSLTGKDVKDGSLTGKDIKNGSLNGKDVKDGSLAMKELKSGVQAAIAIRVTGSLPANGFADGGGTSTKVENTADGVTFGPYADGGTAHGSLCTGVLNGQLLSDVQHLAFEARYTADTSTGGVGVPYLRIFTESGAHDAIFSPNTQSPDPDMDQGPFHTWVATAGSWRYDDDAGSGPDEPFSTLIADHGTDTISNLCISVGSTAGTNLSALLRSWEINSKDYAFGL
jgi:hypothetical protein